MTASGFSLHRDTDSVTAFVQESQKVTNPVEVSIETVITTLNWINVLSFTSADDNTLISLIEATGNVFGAYRVSVDGTEIWRKYSNPMTANNVRFDFKVAQTLLDTEILTLDFAAERILYTSGWIFAHLRGFIEA